MGGEAGVNDGADGGCEFCFCWLVGLAEVKGAWGGEWGRGKWEGRGREREGD